MCATTAAPSDATRRRPSSTSAQLDALPRVDIAYSYAGSDGSAIRAFAAAGAKGIIVAALAPAMVTPGEAEAIKEAVEAGRHGRRSRRAREAASRSTARKLRALGVLTADNLNPQKARSAARASP